MTLNLALMSIFHSYVPSRQINALGRIASLMLYEKRCLIMKALIESLTAELPSFDMDVPFPNLEEQVQCSNGPSVLRLPSQLSQK